MLSVIVVDKVFAVVDGALVICAFDIDFDILNCTFDTLTCTFLTHAFQVFTCKIDKVSWEKCNVQSTF